MRIKHAGSSENGKEGRVVLMRLFHISDVLSATTGRLVSSRHMDGIYEIYSFLVGDDVFTHQISRVANECMPWLAAQFPKIMENAPGIPEWIARLSADYVAAGGDKGEISAVCARWVESVRVDTGMPEMVPVYEMGADMHTRIDPIEELESMAGKDKVVVVKIPE